MKYVRSSMYTKPRLISRTDLDIITTLYYGKYMTCGWMQYLNQNLTSIRNFVRRFARLYYLQDPLIPTLKLLAVNDRDKAWWKHFPRYWPIVQGIHESPVNAPHTKTSDAELWRFFGLRLNKQLSKRSWGCWCETPWRSLWRHYNGSINSYIHTKVWYVIIHPCFSCNDGLVGSSPAIPWPFRAEAVFSMDRSYMKFK